jgi:hypothetical protein
MAAHNYMSAVYSFIYAANCDLTVEGCHMFNFFKRRAKANLEDIVNAMAYANKAGDYYYHKPTREIVLKVNPVFSGFTPMGMSVETDELAADIKANPKDYIHVPVLANFYVWKGLALKIGLQPGFKVREKLYPSVNGIVLPEKYQFGDKAEGFDLRLPLGSSYDFGGVVLEFHTSSGLVKTFKDKDYTNASATLSIGYKFKLK